MMVEDNHLPSQKNMIDANSVKTKIAKIKETKKTIKQLEKLEIEIAQLRRQLSSREKKLSELLIKLN